MSLRTDWDNQYQNNLHRLKNGPVKIIKPSNIPRDGKWIVAKYHSTCPCGIKIKPGDDLWYTGKAYCTTCGHSIHSPELKKLLGHKLDTTGK